MKRKIVFLMACALMIAGISLIVNSVMDFIDQTKKDNETTPQVTASYSDTQI